MCCTWKAPRIAAYADEDLQGALASLKDKVPVLRDRHLRVVDLFRRRGIESLQDTEACVEALASEQLRAEFAVKLKAFLGSLDTVLPRPEGLPFTGDAKRLAYIHARARNRYKDTPALGRDVGAKVRKLIDDHVISLGIDPKIPPIQLTDAGFERELARAVNDRAKASEMEHAIRSHIRKHLDEDPVLYRKLATRNLSKVCGLFFRTKEATRARPKTCRRRWATEFGLVFSRNSANEPGARLSSGSPSSSTRSTGATSAGSSAS
jgi:type I restriction enzyme R subunit